MSVEFVGIELELRGEDGVVRDLQRIDQLVNSLNGKKKLDMGLNDLKRQLVQARGELEKWQRVQSKLKDNGIASEGVNNKVKELKNRIKDLNQGIREVQVSARTMGDTFKQSFNKASSAITHIGSRMQSFGNALTRMTSPFTRLTTGLLYGAGYKALNMLTEGFSGAFERYDTMQTYSKSLQAFGFNASEANEAIKELEQSVLGLPTGLDEIVAVQKRFVASSQDIKKSTGLAIAYNNAILASKSDARQQKTAQRILTQLAGGADIASTSWDALQRSIPMVFTSLAKDADMGVSEYMKALKSGTIATDEFVEAFTKIGTEGKVQAAANVLKTTWEGLTANIQNATKRMGEAVLKALDSAFETYNGRNLVQNLLGFDAQGNEVGGGIKHWINDISEGIQNWVKAHPKEIIDFFNTMKSVDWKGLLKGVAEGFGEVLKMFTAFAKFTSGKDLSGIGKWLVRLSLLGRGLTILGGITKGSSHPLGALIATVKTLARAGKLGSFGKLLSKVFGSKKELVTAGEAAKEIPTVSQSFRGAFNALQGLMKAAGAVLIVSGTGVAAFKAAKSILKDLKEMTDLVNGGGWKNVGYVASGVVVAIGAFTKIFNAIGKALGPQGLLNTAIAGAASVVVTGTIWADTKLILEGLKNIRKTILEFDKIGTAINNLKGINGLNEGAIDNLKKSVEGIIEINNVLNGKSGSPMDRGQVSQGLPWVTSFKPNSIKNLVKTLTNMTGAVNQVNKLASMNISSGAVDKVKSISKVFNQIVKAMPTMVQGGMQGPKNLLANTKGLANALYQMRRMAYSINKLAATDVNTGGFATFIANLKSALNQLKNVSGDLELKITVKLNAGFKKSVDKVIKQINDAKNDIKKTKKGISITIPVSVKFSVSTNLGAALSTIRSGVRALAHAGRGTRTITAGPAQATGGMIYRAKGGSIPFKRRGTDTVPAMLTPGEYVHNKRAVSMFGIDFMRKVNNLDMKGAMNELMHRAGHMANINRGTSITNNNYNNQKVVINNNNAGAGYTFKTASRFVGAF